MKIVLAIGAWIAVAMLGLGLIFGVTSFIGNTARQATRIVEKTIDADNVIANYEWFRQQYQDVQAMDRKIPIMIDAAAAATGW